MARFNRDAVRSSFYVLKPGVYEAKIIEAKAQESRKGDPQWALKFEILELDHFIIIKDWLTWIDEAMQRIEHFLKCFGLWSEEREEYLATETIGKIGKIKIMNKTDAEGRVWNKVPFDGYHTYEPQESQKEEPKDDSNIPF